jgi:hypothetical protein
MEGSKRRSEWIPKVERRFESCRVADELLATAYERALPVLQRATVAPQRVQPPANQRMVMEAAAGQAAGA